MPLFFGRRFESSFSNCSFRSFGRFWSDLLFEDMICHGAPRAPREQSRQRPSQRQNNGSANEEASFNDVPCCQYCKKDMSSPRMPITPHACNPPKSLQASCPLAIFHLLYIRTNQFILNSGHYIHTISIINCLALARVRLDFPQQLDATLETLRVRSQPMTYQSFLLGCTRKSRLLYKTAAHDQGWPDYSSVVQFD
ncbi:hypothetical protein K504DRAFT_238636 [Pleomassaria siparia CBS 279.74]|uniref:Uncharacterized protein n=1 Tax=Pleomassaria siparia CBS 279.74 TaxID=1314801 RepID=A0A6G1KEM1_9PLEO|nr:hypothetical protein K504DRAFT_238636 [Pleomassaria siparia CBS 279.74]